MNKLTIEALRGWLLAAALALTPALATAQAPPVLARAALDTDLRAGPALEYPVVAILLTGTELAVQGCLPDYQWCDVTVNELRGWVYARNILMPYQGQNSPVVQVAPLVGIAVMGFVLEDYWTSYYPTRPWYPQRHLWAHRLPPPPPPPPPHPRGGRQVCRPGPEPVPRRLAVHRADPLRGRVARHRRRQALPRLVRRARPALSPGLSQRPILPPGPLRHRHNGLQPRPRATSADPTNPPKGRRTAARAATIPEAEGPA